MTKTDALQQFSGHLQSVSSGITKGLRERGVGLNEALKAAAQPGGAWAIAKIVDAFAGVVEVDKGVFRITCEGHCSVSELVKRGQYDYWNDWITDERFPLHEHVSVDYMIKLVEFDHDPSSDEVLREFTRRGLERPTYENALYFGVQHSGEQRKQPIVFLHEPVLGPDDRHRILVLDGKAGKRYLQLNNFDGTWNRRCVFAGVHKSR